MDLTISIDNGKFKFTLFEKPLNLYLYIPPNSAHPPGCITGLIFGNVLRIYQLCSEESDIHNPVDNAKAYLQRSDAEHKARKLAKEKDSKQRVFLHLPYHPHDPPSKTVQRLWRSYVTSPEYMEPLAEVTNHRDARIGLRRLTIAYHRAPNL
eukprot:scaffold40247_cov36-Cyclotella_meneghiniana.AAC.1